MIIVEECKQLDGKGIQRAFKACHCVSTSTSMTNTELNSSVFSPFMTQQNCQVQLTMNMALHIAVLQCQKQQPPKECKCHNPGRIRAKTNEFWNETRNLLKTQSESLLLFWSWGIPLGGHANWNITCIFGRKKSGQSHHFRKLASGSSSCGTQQAKTHI